MSLIGRVLGYLSLLANAALALLMLGIGLVGGSAGADLHIDVIPASPESMATVLVLSALVGLAAVILALRPARLPRVFLVLWSLLVSAILVCAFTRGSYRFDGEEHLRMGVYYFAGSLLLLLGSYLRWKHAPASRDS